MAKNREGSINLFGAVQAKTEDGIVAHADGIAVEYDENGKPIKTLAEAIEDGSLGGGNKKTNRPVPNTGLVEKVYFNTSLSDEEVESILNTLTYNEDGQVNVLGVGTASNPIMLLGFLNMEGMQAIVDVVTRKAYWANETFVSTVGSNFGVTTSSWQTFTNPIEVNAEVASEVFGNPIGSQNDKLSQIISIDPFIGDTPKLSLVWDDLFDLSSTKEKFNNIDITEELYNQVKSANKLEVEISNSTQNMKINLVLQTTQIEEQDKLIRLGLTTDKYFIEVGLQLLEDSTSGYILFQFREILGIIDVEELPSATIDTSTEVPSSGQVGKVYFNTKLSVEEVVEIFKSLDYVSGIKNNPLVGVVTNADMTQGLIVEKAIQDNAIVYRCTHQYANNSGGFTTTTPVAVISIDGGVTWELTCDSEVDLNIDNMLSVLAPQVGMTIQNSKLKNLISTTPFEAPNTDIEVDKLYRTPIKTKPTVVSNTGLINNIYFNTKLSDTEIQSLLSGLTYNSGSYYVFASGENMTNDDFVGIAIGNFNDGYCIMYNISHSPMPIWCDENFKNGEIGSMIGITTPGWQEFTNPIEINKTAQSSILNGSSVEQIGLENDKLINLISLTPFGSGELKGYKYHQFVEGEWKELGSGGEVENAPVVIEKDLHTSSGSNLSITDDEWNTIINKTNVTLKINTYNSSDELVVVMYAHKLSYNKSLQMVVFRTLYLGSYECNIGVIKNDTEYSFNTQMLSRITSVGPCYINGNSLMLCYSEEGEPLETSLYAIDTETATDSDNLITSKAVRNYIAEYMTANYDNGDTEEF